MSARHAAPAVLLLIAAGAAAPAQDSATGVRITPVDAAGSPLGAAFAIPCQGSRCEGRIRLDASGRSYLFEAMVLFTPGYAHLALEPVPDASGRMMFLAQDARHPVGVPTDRNGFGHAVINLVEVARPESGSPVQHPVVRGRGVARVRIDVIGPRSP